MLNWAAWLRMHHQDPQWMQKVIKEDCWDGLDFSVWDHLENWESRVDLKLLDTSGLAINEVSASVANWFFRSPIMDAGYQFILEESGNDCVQKIIEKI